MWSAIHRNAPPWRKSTRPDPIPNRLDRQIHREKWVLCCLAAANSRNPQRISGKQALFEARAADFELLAISPDHAAAVDGSPIHHRDPFDCLLVAQSRCESMHLLTHDSKLADYGDFDIVV